MKKSIKMLIARFHSINHRKTGCATQSFTGSFGKRLQENLCRNVNAVSLHKKNNYL